MRIVKLSDLSEKEKKKVLEEQENRLKSNNTNNKLQQNKKISYNISSQPTETKRIYGTDLSNMMKDTSKEAYNEYKKKNNITLWDSIKETANDLGKVGENTWLGAKNGILYWQQNFNKLQQNNLANQSRQLESNFMQNILSSDSSSAESKRKAVAILSNNQKEQSKLDENSKNYAEKLQQKINQNKEKITENSERIDSSVLKKVSELAPSVGQMAPQFIPGVGVIYMAGSSRGQYYDDAIQRGMNEEQADKYSTIMALAETGTELIGMENLKKAGTGIKALIKGAGKEASKETVKTGIRQVLKNYGIGIADNVIQEAIIEPISEITAQIVAGKNSANWDNILERSIQAGIDGGLVAIITGGANIGIQSCVSVVDNMINGKTVTQQEIKNAVEDASKKLDTSKIVTDSIKKETSNLQQNTIKNKTNLSEQQTTQQVNKATQNPILEQKHTAFPMKKLTYEESARKYNIDTNNETVQSINKVTQSRGINARFDADIFIDNNANAMWITKTDANSNRTREVILNPNADTKKALQNVIVHELTHDFEGTTEYKELKDLVLSYDEGNVGFEKARESLGEIYSKVYDRNSIEFQSLIDNEAVADILGNKLGTQEFIDTLTMQKPTTARKIYNWVIDKLNKLNKLTGYSSEKIFWADVKNKFENAYRQEYKGSDVATKFDIITEGNKQYVKATRQVISGNNPLIWEQQVENYINETIRNGQDVQVFAYDGDILSITKDTAGKAKFRNEVIDKNGNKRRLNNKEFMAKLRAETHIDELAKTSKHKQGPIPDTKNHSFAKDGFTYRTAYFEDIDGTYYRITMSVGKNGNINTIYNIGKMQDWQKNRRYSISELKGSSGKPTSDRISSTNSIPSSNENVNTAKYSIQESENNSGSFNLPKNYKQQQLEIVLKNNPADDEYHTWIRTVDDIKTFKETLQDSDWIGWEETGFDPDYTADIVKNAIKTGKITVYSSYPIKQGIFVTPSKMEAESYSGSGKIYSKNVKLEDIAWIDPTQGQYAKVDNYNSIMDNKGRTLSKEQQEYFKDSKARDKNGNLLEVYHGTNGDFTEFDMSYLGSASGDVGFLGDGFYLATHKGEAKYYGSKIMNGYANIINPYNIKELSKYKGKTFNGEDSSSGLHIKNLVELNPQWRDIEINNTTYREIADEVTNYLENVKVKKLGIVENSYGNDSGIMWEISFKGKKTQDESILNYTEDEMAANALNKHIRNKFGYINNSEIIQYITEQNRFNKNIKSLREVLQEKGYDSIVQGTPQDTDEIVIFDSNQFKNIDNTNPTDNPDIRYSLPTKEWQQYLDENYKSTGTRTNLEEIRLPIKRDNNAQTQENIPKYEVKKDKKVLNPLEIANLNEKDANTTPNLKKRNYAKGNKQSSFFANVVTDSKFLNEDLRQKMADEDNIRYYKGISNQETLEKAFNSLSQGGESATLNWFKKDEKNTTAEDVAKGWILLKQYQDKGDYESAVEVAKKMREMGTGAGQAVQAYNILSRLTPEGMFLYAQSELSEAYNKMVEGKTKKWIEENQSKFDLTPEETQFIKETMQDVANMEDGYAKREKIAQIQKIVSDKIPPTAGQSIKAWMRISMLLNPKTQVRNIMGNAVILPVNVGSDFMASGIDKLISKKTGIRTTGNINLKNYSKGFGKGLYESYNDFRKGINTRNIEGNRFEVSEGKNFNDNGIGKALNKLDNVLSFMLDAGDRGFYEATFINSINNQLVLNNTTEVTKDMIDIATTEALQRTWQDNNAYTKAVLKIRNILNSVNVKGYGLGDVLIPFAKTPANLTKAIVDYSPAGLIKAITLDARTFKNSLENGQYTPQLQHKLVQNIGKGMAGSFLYVLGYALAKAGIASGEADDDKDVKNFMKNSLGISSYSIKIGNKTFTYDWAQPIATPLAIMTNYVKYSEENPNVSIIDKAIKSLNIGTEQLLQQSFMESLNTVLNGSGTTLENLSQAILELPSRAIPTLSKQIADMVDGAQRTSFEYDKPVQSAINSVTAKIPFASKTLPVSRDTLGNEIQKYGGENNWFNVFLNPANVNKKQLSKAGEEIYKLYQETGETTIFPITAPYYINSSGEKIIMSAEQRSNYQKVTGEYAEKAIEELLSNLSYKKLSNAEKVELLQDIIGDSNAKAKYEVLNIETDEAKKKRELIEAVSTKNYYDYRLKTKNIEGENENMQKNKVLLEANYSDKVKSIIYENTTGKDDSLYAILSNGNIEINEYLQYKIKEANGGFLADKDEEGNSISGTSKSKYYTYVKNNITGTGNKLLILGKKYKLNDSDRKALAKYINEIIKTEAGRLEVYEQLDKNYVVKNNKVYYKG